MAATPTSQKRTHYWQEQIKAWQGSGQSQQAFCRTHDLNYPRFVYWRRKLQPTSADQPPPARPQPPAFIPVVRSAASRPSGLSLVLPSGLELRGIAPDNLALVQQLVARWS